uniref:Uncharacterized protein n=1 Tax=Populus davidiana TaxID=266767 RepID=A0A6M2EXY0_9ROSI
MTGTSVTSKFNVVTKLKISAPLASDESSRFKQEKSIRKSDPHYIQICNFYLFKMRRGFLAKNKGYIWFWSFSLRVLGRFLDHETLKHETGLIYLPLKTS